MSAEEKDVMEKQMKAESGRESYAIGFADGGRGREAGKRWVLPWEPLKGAGFNFNLKQHKYVVLWFWSPKVQRESQGDKIMCWQRLLLPGALKVNRLLLFAGLGGGVTCCSVAQSLTLLVTPWTAAPRPLCPW